MSATPPKHRFSRYRDEVKEQVEAGDPFSEVEEVIELAELAQDEKDALWLMAFSMRDVDEQHSNASGRLAVVADR